jgi:hypothetical protein
MKKINWTPEQEAEINRIQRTTGVTRDLTDLLYQVEC